MKLVDVFGRKYGEYSHNLLEEKQDFSFELTRAYSSNPQFLIAVIYIKMEDEVYIKQQKLLRLP